MRAAWARCIGRGNTKLDRDVAIKVLPEDFATDPERLARFEREAKLLASLNHANIAMIHGFEDSGGVRFIAMELVEGETLAERLPTSGRLEVEETLEIARQIAEALEAAHENGVIHRDLKPANVVVTPEGKVKVLDFGLAKAYEADGSPSELSPDLSHSPTMAQATRTGVILGTAAYMSPEQARAKPVDKRSDIWAFGCVLYEMLSGRRAFDGETVSDTMAAILKEEPDWDLLPDGTQPALSRLIRRCVEKDPRRRLRDIGDARTELEDLRDERPEFPPTAGLEGQAQAPKPDPGGLQHLRHPAMMAFIIAAVGAVAFWLGGLWRPATPTDTLLSRVTIPLPEGQRQPRLMAAPLAISPDGTLLAYAARDETGVHLFLCPLDSSESRKVPDSLHADAPFFSPDGQWVGFFAAGRLKKVAVSGGSPLLMTRAAHSASGASWGPDDNIVFSSGSGAGLWTVPAIGGNPEQLTRPDFGENGYAHVWPQHLPDGRHVLFNVWIHPPRILDLETGDSHDARVGTPGDDLYLSSGHLTFADSVGVGALLAAPFDLQGFAASGAALPVLDDVRHFYSGSTRPHIAVSRTGTAVYVSHDAEDATLMWVDREGRTVPIRQDQLAVSGIRLSPDGETAVFGDEQGNLWTLDIERGAVTALARSPELHASNAIWNPDGRRVTFSSTLKGSWDIYEIDVAERDEPQPLLVSELGQFPSTWSTDGQLLAYYEIRPVTGTDIWILPSGEEPVPVLNTENNEFSPALSPDGRLLAYVTDETGRLDVLVRTYPEGETRVVSLNGGEEPMWSRDGRELFFRQGDRLFAVEVSADPELDVSTPQPLFEMRFERGAPNAHYDVSLDGERFLVVSDRPATEFKVIFNWFEELKELVPVGSAR